MEDFISVKDIMTPKKTIISLKPDDTIKDVLKNYKTHYYHSFPVINEEEELEGVVDEDIVLIRLLFDHLEPKEFSRMIGRADIKHVEKFISEEVTKLSSHPISISPDAHIEEAAATMIKQHVDRMMVTVDDKLLGVISKRDIIRKLIKKKR